MLLVQEGYWSLSKLISTYPELIFFQYGLLFILFFSLIYDSLVISKIFIVQKDGNEDDPIGRKINLTIAASLAILALRNPFIINALTRSISTSIVTILPILLFMILLAFLTERETGEVKETGRGVLYIISMAVILWIFLGNILGDVELTSIVWGFLGITGPSGELIWMILTIIFTLGIVIGAMWFIVKQ